jgi:outer membrane receptor protein involved in Fe transport
MVAQNIGRASIRGLELILRVQILGMIKMQMGYTFLDPRDRSGIEPYDGRMLPNRPRHDMFLGGSVSRWSVTLGYRMDLLSGGFIDRASLRPIAERAIHSLSVEWEPGFLKGFVLGMELWNAGNLVLSEREVSSGDRTYAVREAVSDVDGYPLPGLGVYFCAGFKK